LRRIQPVHPTTLAVGRPASRRASNGLPPTTAPGLSSESMLSSENPTGEGGTLCLARGRLETTLRLVGLRCVLRGLAVSAVAPIVAFEDPSSRGRLPGWGSCRSLLIFTPSSPTRFDPAARAPRCRGTSFLSWGCSKIPSVVSITGESTPGDAARFPGRRLLRTLRATAASCSDLVVFHHLAGFLLPGAAKMLHLASDPGAHPVSVRPRQPPSLAGVC
jgi:hypothetical protein